MFNQNAPDTGKSAISLDGLVQRTAGDELHGQTGRLTMVPGGDPVEDMDEMFERIIPKGREYHHNLRWQDGNGHAHVRASLLGPSLTVPFSNGKLHLGVWQQVVLVDFDNRSRNRDLVCQVIGE